MTTIDTAHDRTKAAGYSVGEVAWPGGWFVSGSDATGDEFWTVGQSQSEAWRKALEHVEAAAMPDMVTEGNV